MKACLVALSYEGDSHNLKTNSPTYSREAMRIVILTASVMKSRVESLDFTSVYLQGDKPEREIYIFLKPPSNICPESQVKVGVTIR